MGPVSVQVWNQLGQVVSTPMQAFPNSVGYHEVKLTWGDLPPGLYRIALSIGGEMHDQEVVKH